MKNLSKLFHYLKLDSQIYTKAELPFAKLNDNSVLERVKSHSLDWTIPSSMPEQLGTLLVSILFYTKLSLYIFSL